MIHGVEMQKTTLSISSKVEISAIYYALLQCGYGFYTLEKEEQLVSRLVAFREERISARLSFFSEIKQNTCEVYPYWPRAAILEEASFYLDKTCTGYVQFSKLQNRVMSAGNISPKEKGEALWDWITQFPAAINDVLISTAFQNYCSWEKEWIEEQNQRLRSELTNLLTILQKCSELYEFPMEDTHILLNPIKCAYSSDYYRYKGKLYFSLGLFRPESVIHEFMHSIIHLYVIQNKDKILQHRGNILAIDESYLQDGSDAGKLNAAEEYFVRALTERAVCGTLPNDLNQFIQDKMKEF